MPFLPDPVGIPPLRLRLSELLVDRRVTGFRQAGEYTFPAAELTQRLQRHPVEWRILSQLSGNEDNQVRERVGNGSHGACRSLVLQAERDPGPGDRWGGPSDTSSLTWKPG